MAESHGEAPSRNKPSTRAYSTWLNMRQRCCNPKHPAFSVYGGRGITVCRRWDRSFLAFLSDMGRPAVGMTLERKDTNKGYSPSNCVWATRKQQMNNVRYNRWIKYQGERHTMTQWAELCGVSPATMHWRLANWGVERAVSTRKGAK